MNGTQFSISLLLQIVIIIMLWVVMSDLGYITKVADNVDGTASAIFDILDRRF